MEVAVLMFESLVDSTQAHSLATIDFKVFDNYVFPAF